VLHVEQFVVSELLNVCACVRKKNKECSFKTRFVQLKHTRRIRSRCRPLVNAVKLSSTEVILWRHLPSLRR